MRSLLLAIILSLPTASVHALELVDDLKRDADYAREHQLIVMILVTTPECPYCDYVKSHHLAPMVKNASLQQTAVVRELDLSGVMFKDFDGKSIQPMRFASRYQASFAPTVLFLTPEGEALVKPLVGLSSRDYYGFYLDRSIKKSVNSYRNP